ncbi:25699_t:CDS:1, partial [Racocetra persica]
TIQTSPQSLFSLIDISEALLYPLPLFLPISLYNSLLHEIQETSISKNNIQESTPHISTSIKTI